MALVDPSEVQSLSNEEFQKLTKEVFKLQQIDIKENQLLYYKPVSEKSRQIHHSSAKVLAAFGGNGSSKTETTIVEALICVLGIVPYSLEGVFDRRKLRGPISVRIVCESLTTVLYPIILPKLQWWQWTGESQPGGKRGHWGWIPRTHLIDGKWDKSWNVRDRILRVLYRDPENPHLNGESMIQFMSKDQDPSDFASGDFHIVVHDEPPTYAIWRENQARTMRVNGRMLLAMTWPDDPSIPVDWIFDEVYDRGQGVNKDKDIEWVNLYTTENPHLNQEAIKDQVDKWSNEVTKVRIYGEPIRFSNRIHPLFTDQTQTWCFPCGRTVIRSGQACGHCGSEHIVEFNHVKDFDISRTWPTIFAIDPHPRKPHMYLWAQIDPMDDLWVIGEGSLEGDPVDVKKELDRFEKEKNLVISRKLIDPNMGASPSGARRGVTWRDEFDQAGIFCELSDDSDVGRSRINKYLEPDPHRLQPRIHIHPRCENTIFQMKRYVWDDFREKLEKDIKQKPKPKHDDYPTLLKYILNTDPAFRMLKMGAPVIHRYGVSHGTKTTRRDVGHRNGRPIRQT